MEHIVNMRGFVSDNSKDMRAEFASRDWAKRNEEILIRSVWYWLVAGAFLFAFGFFLDQFFAMGLGLVFFFNSVCFPFIYRTDDDPLLKLSINIMLFYVHLKIYFVSEQEAEMKNKPFRGVNHHNVEVRKQQR